MKIITSVCAHCERSADEIKAQLNAEGRIETPLEYTQVGANRVLLCPDDRLASGMTESEINQLIEQPIQLPAGTVSVEHTCPMLLYDGATEEEATSTITLSRSGDFRYGNCPECGMQVVSAL